MKGALSASSLLGLGLAAVAGPHVPRSPAAAGGTLAVQAGRLLLVEDGVVIEGGATLLVRDGRIVATGKDLAIPPDARLVDYGPDAVIAPGLIDANSPFGLGPASQRTADPSVRALDGFDPFSQAYLADLAGGVTSVYLVPGRNRLIAGQGAVVKLAGADVERRVLHASSALQGSVGPDARIVPGYWKPPVPATVDEGLGRAEPQLPGSLMGALVALRELLAFARREADHSAIYGPETGPALAALLREGVPWRMRADSEQEIRGLLDLAQAERLPLVIEGAGFSGQIAAEIARAGVKVVVEPDFTPQQPGRDLGTEREARWPVYDNAAALSAAGVPITIATPDGVRPRDLRFAAALASRGGLSQEAALRAITLSAAEMLGVAHRVGSLTPGKDADFAVFSGHPLDLSSTVISTWVDGELAWKAPDCARAVVLEVEELHVGDGSVLSPGEVLVRDGKIAEVGRRVAHPAGAMVVRGEVAMPGMIDAGGHLGLEGSSKSPATDFKLRRLVAPGDRVDRRVAQAGVTTVILSPRGDTKGGTPLMAYKPASSDLERMSLSDPTALRLSWTDRNRVDSGKEAKALLEKAVEYDKKWREYEEALAKWKAAPPAAPEEAPAAEAGKEGEKAGEEPKEGEKKEEKEDEKTGEKGAEEKKDEPKPKSKKDEKKDEKETPEADAVSGIWETDVVMPPRTDPAHLRLRLELTGVEAKGWLRCDAVADDLVELEGTYGDGELSLTGLGSRGFVAVSGKPEKGELKGKLTLGDASIELAAKRTSTELPRAARSERRREKKEEEKEDKRKPKAPGLDEKLEPLRRALHGEAAVVVSVDRREEIRECVAAFEQAGIKPVLHGADDAWRMSDELVGRVAGVLLSQRVLEGEPRGGLSSERNRLAELEAAGIPVAFQSNAEEGAAELPLLAAFAIAHGMSPDGAVRALCANAATMFAIDRRVGLLAPGRDGDVLLLDGPPLDPRTRVLRAWVDGEEIR